MKEERTFDPIWEDIYRRGDHLNRYPWDLVVSFVYCYAPRGKSRSEIRVLEVGCGAGSNLWFAAREGFDVAGVDCSESAIAFARERFASEGLAGDLRVGDFTQLPFESDSFDLAIDRAAITCCGLSAGARAVADVRRVLRPGGDFLFNAYSDHHTSHMSGTPGPDGLTVDINGGTLVGAGQLCFYGRRDIDALFSEGWNVLSVQHTESVEELGDDRSIHAEWRVIAEKVEAR